MDKELSNEFPELSQSTLRDVLKTYSNDVSKAKDALRDVIEEEKKEKQKKIDEISQQFSLDKETIRKILEQNNWSIEDALLPLFNKQEELNEARKLEERKQREQQQQKKKADDRQAQVGYLIEIFRTLNKEVVQTILDNNEGDVEETINELAVLVQQQEQKQREEQARRKQVEQDRDRMKQEQENRMKAIKEDALKEKFPELDLAQHILPALVACDWDIKLACQQLVALDNDRKKNQLKGVFAEFSDVEIVSALEKHDWNNAKAYNLLMKMREDAKPKQAVVKEQDAKLNIKKVEQTLLDRSIMLTNQVEQTIQLEKHKQEEEALKDFKKELSHILSFQVREQGTLPGLVPPPLPAQIRAKLHPEEPKVNNADSAPVVPSNLPPPVTSSTANTNSSASSIAARNVILKASPAVVDCGQTITCEYQIQGTSGTSRDWIGLYAVDTPNKQYVTYQWINNLQKGALTVTAPTQYGIYEFRYFGEGSYEHAAMSNQISVGPQIDLEVTLVKPTNKIQCKWSQSSGNSYSRAWIGLFEKSQPNKNYITWEYAGSGEVSFDAPIKPGLYECRFFSYSYYDIKRSNEIRIEGDDKFSANYDAPSSAITCKLSLVTIDPTTDSIWVGIYFVNEKDTKQWRRYKYVKDRFADIVFKAPKTAGEYEARLFANKGSEPLYRSSSFTIEKR